MDKYTAMLETYISNTGAYTKLEWANAIHDFLEEFNVPTGPMINLLAALTSAESNEKHATQLFLNKFNSEQGIV